MSVWFYAWLDVYRQACSPLNTNYPDLYIHAQSHKHKAQPPPLEAMLESCLFSEALHYIKYVYSRPQTGAREQTTAFSEVKKKKQKSKIALTSICLKAANKDLPCDENTLKCEYTYQMT